MAQSSWNRFQFRAPLLALALVALTGCPLTIAQDAPPQPIVTARPGTTGPFTVFGGFLYPRGDGSFRHEVDVPLTTSTETASAYYAFEVNYQVAGLRNIELAWRFDANQPPVPLRKITGPCDDGVAGEAWLRSMEINALTQTGRRDVPTSFSPESEALLDAGTIVWWVTCSRAPGGGTISGEVIAADNKTVDYNVAVLMPLTAMPFVGGSLEAVARNVADGQVSAPTRLLIERSPALVGVVGDEVAWGAGVPEPAKLYRRFATALSTAALNPRFTIPARPATATAGATPISASTSFSTVVVKAHAGAAMTGTPPSPTIAGATGCPNLGADPVPVVASGSYGEVPIGAPTVQCQIRDLATMICRVSLPQLAPVRPTDARVPDFLCAPTTGSIPPATLLAGTILTFDIGPRFDFVLMSGCLNDVNANAVLLGGSGYNDFPTLTAAVAARCDMRTLVPDIKAFLPNAQIIHLGYHVMVSTTSNMLAVGCTVAVPPIVALPFGPPPPLPACPFIVSPLSPLGVVCALSDPVQRNMAAGRWSMFLTDSNGTLAATVGAVQASPANGRGSYGFVPLAPVSPFTSATAFMTGVGSSQTWGLGCALGAPPIPGLALFAPVDPMAGPRAPACTAAANPTGTTPGTVAEESCKLASAFYPDTIAQGTMDTFIRLILGSRFVRP